MITAKDLLNEQKAFEDTKIILTEYSSVSPIPIERLFIRLANGLGKDIVYYGNRRCHPDDKYEIEDRKVEIDE